MTTRTAAWTPVPLLDTTALTLGPQLLSWFEASKRPMPWRETRDPYGIWVSEVMLQQTQVATVIPYYERFMQRFPTIRALAEAPLDDLLKHWEGLGYYSRARNLQKAAQVLVRDHRAEFPRDYDAIRALPGVGDYTAGAVSSIAFNQPRSAVDGNVFRVLSRLFALKDDVTRPQTRKIFEDLAERLIPPGEAWRFNQALMEFGATLCTPVNPRCSACPLAGLCAARTAGEVEIYPVKTKKAAPKDVAFAVGVVQDPEGRLLITRRPAEGLLGGLWEFPTVEVPTGTDPVATLQAFLNERGLVTDAPAWFVTVPHTFTHLKAQFHAYRLDGQGARADETSRWVTLDELSSYAYPLAHTKIRQALDQPAQLSLGFGPQP